MRTGITDDVMSKQDLRQMHGVPMSEIEPVLITERCSVIYSEQCFFMPNCKQYWYSNKTQLTW